MNFYPVTVNVNKKYERTEGRLEVFILVVIIALTAGLYLYKKKTFD